jgi:lincosamide nucleotidyltransferase A/C/D/E
MDAGAVLDVLAALERAGIRVWLDGGWGVDALLGEQTRGHADLDIILNSADAPRLQETLVALGFGPKPGGTATNFVLTDARGREIDVHPVEIDRRGYALFALADGRRWPFPPAAFAGRGVVAGREVRCLSVDAQVQCHAQGYEPTENDLGDMEKLQERFGVVLPIGLCRQEKWR